MPEIDLVDDTFVAAPPERVAAVVRDPGRWARWWPDLDLVLARDRGVKGVQWVVRGSTHPGGGSGRGWRGTAEIWLEPWGDGVLVHHYLRLDPVGVPVGADRGAVRRARWLDAQRRARAVQWKRHVHALKDDLEAGRGPGEPVAG